MKAWNNTPVTTIAITRPTLIKPNLSTHYSHAAMNSSSFAALIAGVRTKKIALMWYRKTKNDGLCQLSLTDEGIIEAEQAGVNKGIEGYKSLGQEA